MTNGHLCQIQCGLRLATCLGCSAELKPRARPVCCLLSSSGITLGLLLSQQRASVRWILPFSPYVMSTKLLSRQTQRHTITFCSFISLYVLTASPSASVHPSDLLARSSRARSCVSVSFIYNEKSLQARKRPDPYG